MDLKETFDAVRGGAQGGFAQNISPAADGSLSAAVGLKPVNQPEAAPQVAPGLGKKPGMDM